MAVNISSGLLMCRLFKGELQYFLVHPGGPYFKKRDTGAWSIPKGLPNEGEPLVDAAQREFFEETGIRPSPPFFDLGNIRQKGGKTVYAWGFMGEWDRASGIICNEFPLEWPPRSGRQVMFPEVDKADWFSRDDALVRMIAEQTPFLERAERSVTGQGSLKQWDE